MSYYYGNSAGSGGWMQAPQSTYAPAQHLSAGSMFEYEMGFNQAGQYNTASHNPWQSRSQYSRPQYRGGNGQNFRGARGHNGPNRSKQNKQVEKSFAYFCNACDRGYNTNDKYNEHCATHVQCKIDGCKYTAAEKLVELHRGAQHRNGLFKKIWCLESPAELNRWIEERKRNYPSAIALQQKARNQVARAERGQILSDKQARFNPRYQQRRGRGRGRDWAGSDANGNARQSQCNSQRNYLIGDFDDEQPDPSVMATDTSTCRESDWTLAACDDKDSHNETEQQSVVHSKSTGLSQLICMYGDSEDEDGGQVTAVADLRRSKSPESSCTNQQQPSCSTAAEHEKHENETRRNDAERRSNGNQRGLQRRPGPTLPATPASGVRKSTLLEKLLHTEIRHERNVILQCIRHIVNANFFDKS